LIVHYHNIFGSFGYINVDLQQTLKTSDILTFIDTQPLSLGAVDYLLSDIPCSTSRKTKILTTSLVTTLRGIGKRHDDAKAAKLQKRGGVFDDATHRVLMVMHDGQNH
jgi:hypothetical protein